MKNPALLFPRVAIALFCLTSPVWAANGTFTVTNGQTNTTAQSLSSGGVGTVNAGGTLNVNGSSVAITVTGTSTITNAGLIEQTGSARAIRDNTGSLALSVTNSGTITTVGADTFQMNKPASSVTLMNSGTISSTGITGSTNGQAVDWGALNTNVGTSTLTNTAGGLITAADSDAIEGSQNMVLNNDGVIKSGGSGNDGINAGTNTNETITNASANLSTNGNLIEGSHHGITGGNLTGTGSYSMSITNNSHGVIKGDDGSGINIDGVNGNEVVTIVNAGLISGNGVTGDGDGVDVDGLVHLTNSGTINSTNYLSDTSEGVTVGGGSISNSGLIEGTASGTSTAIGRGITLAGVDKDAGGNTIPIQKIYADTTVFNSGLIKGDSSSGIGILGFNTTVTATYTATNYSVTITNTAGGVIEGAGSVAAIDGGADITVGGTGTASSNNETVINYGTIKADSGGKAISLGMGNNSVQIVGPSASIIGDMSGGTLTGTNTAALTIDPTAGHSFSYGGVISNFTSVEILSGTVTFSGANTYNGTTTIDAARLNLSGPGTIGTTTVLTINTGGIFDLGGGTVTVGSLANSGTITNGTVNTTGTGTISGLSGNTAFNKTSAGTTVITGTNTYTGGTTVSNGKLAVNGSITGNVNVHTGAEVGGNGTISGTISGSGSVGPGNSPGILTATSTDPSGGLAYNFELTQVGTATWSNASASGNDVLHLTAALPFTTALTSGNGVNLYFSSLNLTFEGGFFTDGSTDTLTANISNATYNYFVLDNASGTFLYNGNKYDQVTGTAGVVQVFGANFATGTVNGWTEQFTAAAAPEPSTYVLLVLGALAWFVIGRRNLRIS